MSGVRCLSVCLSVAAFAAVAACADLSGSAEALEGDRGSLGAHRGPSPHATCGLARGTSSPPWTLGLDERHARPAVEPELLRGMQLRESEHFALRWGPLRTVTDAQANATLAVGEAAFTRLVEELGFPPPETAHGRIQMFVGDSGGGTPDAPFNYVDIDASGHPFIVLQPTVVELASFRPAEHGAIVAHEFFHTIQLSQRSFGRRAEYQFWYFEATAEWAAAELFPTWVALDKLPSYVLYPDYSLRALPDPIEEELAGEHMYGAGIFAHYLDEFEDGAALLRASWLGRDPDDDPLTVLDELLADHGRDLATIFAEFAARTAVLDYPERDELQELVDRALSTADDGHSRVTAIHDYPTSGFVEAPPCTAPQAYGFNTVAFKNPGTRAEITLQSDSLEALRATVVVRRGDAFSYHPLALEGSALHVALTDLDPADELSLVVAATPAAATPEESFPYQYSYATDRPIPVVAEVRPPAVRTGRCRPSRSRPAPGAGCSAAGSTDGTTTTLLLALFALSAIFRTRARRSR